MYIYIFVNVQMSSSDELVNDKTATPNKVRYTPYLLLASIFIIACKMQYDY